MLSSVERDLLGLYIDRFLCDHQNVYILSSSYPDRFFTKCAPYLSGWISRSELYVWLREHSTMDNLQILEFVEGLDALAIKFKDKAYLAKHTDTY